MCGVQRETSLDGGGGGTALEPASPARRSEAQGGLHMSASTNRRAAHAIDASFTGDCDPATSCYPNSPFIRAKNAPTMISDNQLYSLAVFLGSAAMLLIVVYHFLEINSEDQVAAKKSKGAAAKARS
ncbi:hypothetical protein ACEQ8H_003786 [Pleosporales sp. CAS-2024a]